MRPNKIITIPFLLLISVIGNYLLGLLVDIFCGVFSNGVTGMDIYGTRGAPPGVGHFFAALNPDMFGGLDMLRDNLSRLREKVQSAPRASDRDHIFFAGEKEYLAEQRNRDTVPVQPEVEEALRALSERFNQPL